MSTQHQHSASTGDYAGLHAKENEAKDAKRNCCVFAILFLLAAGAAIALGVLYFKLKADNGSTPAPQPDTSGYGAIAKEIDACRNVSIDPCEDFFEYACGGWITAHTPIPSDTTRYSRSFSVISDNNIAVLKKINDENWPVIGPFYQSCMDTASIDAQGRFPVTGELARIDSIGDRATLMWVAADLLQRLGVSSFFSLAVVVDSKNPSKNILNIGQGGLSLPSASYYSDPTKTSGFLDHITQMFLLLDEPRAHVIANETLNVEEAIAKFTKSPAEMRDPDALYNKYTYPTLVALADLNWDRFFNASRITAATLDANVEVPDFLVNINILLDETPLPALKAYLQWKVLHSFANRLPAAYRNETFRFFGQVLGGQAEPAPRWKDCTNNVDSALGDILGRYFVERAFPGKSKNITQQLIALIEEAFGAQLPNLGWMDDVTQEHAVDKLKLIVDLVGFPAVWTDYSSVTIKANDFVGNINQLRAFQWGETLKVLSGPVDKTKWQMSPPTVNAYYDPSYNTINFPAGIIQPTFFDATYPMAMNFGGIGMVMGHELTHGFDDQGAKYDGHGKLTNWWSNASLAAFEERSLCLSHQYSAFQIPTGEHVNGNLTLGENIADNGGIRIAFRAYKKWVEKNGAQQQVPTTTPITNDQLFFLSFAQGWCSITTPENAKERLLTDPHSPPFARVLGPLQNYDEFAKAYSCPSGSKMNPVNKCNMW